MVSLLITRVDSVEPYHDIAHNFKDPLPVFRPAGKDGDDAEQPEPGQGHVVQGQNERDSSEDGGRGHTGDRPESVSKQKPDVPSAQVTSTTAAPADNSSSEAPGALLPPDHTSSAQILASIAGGSTPQPPSDASKQPETQEVHPSHSAYDQPMDMSLEYSMDPLPDWTHLAQQNVDPPSTVPPGFGLESGVYHQLGHSSEPLSKAPSVHEHHATLELEGMALGRNVEHHGKEPGRYDSPDVHAE